MRIGIITTLSLAAVAAAPASGSMRGAALAPLARIPPAKARHVALAARPGTIKDGELEREKGGSGLRFSFDILAQGKVGVDARTGAILENGVDRKAD